MRTTIELPDDLFKAAKVEAVQQGTTLKSFIESAVRAQLNSRPPARRYEQTKIWQSSYTEDEIAEIRECALARMKRGYDLGGKPLTREEAHERRSVH